MKHQLLLPITILAFLLTQCKDNSKSEPKHAGADTVDVSVTVMQYGQNKPLDSVIVSVDSSGTIIHRDTTGSNGKCLLTNITSNKKYDFFKSGYTPQNLDFLAPGELRSLNLYMKHISTDPFIAVTFIGKVQNTLSMPFPNVKVKSGDDSTYTDSTGFYRLIVPKKSQYNLQYLKNGGDITIQIGASPDTTKVDVFVDAFQIDTVGLKIRQ